jgi:hypothetical protein
MESFIPVAATPDFAYMLDIGDRSYRYRSTYMYSIEVSGAAAGTVRESNEIVVPESLGYLDTPPSKFPPPFKYELNPNWYPKSDLTGLVLGVVMGVLVGLFMIYCFCKRSPASDDEKKKQAAQAAVNQAFTQGHKQTEVVENPGQATRYIVRPTEVPMAQVPGMNGPYQSNTTGQPHPAGVYPQTPGQPMQPMPQPAPIAISDAMTITPAAIAVPPSQSGQDQMQHLQLSRHPRPNVVTSVGDNDQSNSQQLEVKSGPDQ